MLAAPAIAHVAVVVHYRFAAPTQRCIDSLLTQSPPLEVLVVDNGSPDGSGAELARSNAGRERVHVVHNRDNRGFGAGCNRGFDEALRRWPGLQYVLLLNPDAELAAGALAELLATARRHPGAAVVGCRIDDDQGRPWFQNGRVPRWTLRGFHCRAPAATEFATEFVTGACMLLRAPVLRAGLRFDERYFLYCEDADLCCQVRALGHELWITHAARVRHTGGGSQPGTPVLGELNADRVYWLARAKVLFARYRLGPLQRAAFFALAFVGKPLAALLTQRGLRWVRPYFRGLCSGLGVRRAALSPSAPSPA
ncbi:MAG: glycosyltransferase family 2 protein [Planctomycetes bacterium]|nr:glycosyltransferase family 2 protein [Planctomycetota bacterium]